MNIVKNAVVRQQGTISIDSEAHKGTTFTIRLPMALAVTRALLVKAGEQTFAFPLKIIKHISRLTTFESLIGGRWRETLTGGQTGLTDNEHKTKASEQPANSAIFYLNELLGLPPASANDDTTLLLLKTQISHSPCWLTKFSSPKKSSLNRSAIRCKFTCLARRNYFR
jgi:chemosensory pili system protein ChpA (sensor histidine kinase/response regulator)